ncbi:hypothetical protein BZM26_38345 [Paraburkholderia strydomiana]|nr:hypothetical protein BZM26_38345 [Paraburkholderia strydomiana]
MCSSIGCSLARLRMPSDAIHLRDINRQEPLDVGHVPTKARPLVDAINLLALMEYPRDTEL